jgi:hypothetical protein
VIANDPVSGNGEIEPGEFCLVGVAAVAGFFEDLFYLGRSFEVGGDRWIGKRLADKLDC